MSRFHMATVLAAIALSPSVSAQTTTAEPSFDVTSVKVRAANDSTFGGNANTPNGFSRSNVSLRDLIEDAYGVAPFEIAGLPEWGAFGVRFEVEGKATFAPTPEQMRLLKQRLLADRFSLKTHTEKREMTVYVLRLARADGRLGSQLKKTPVDCDAIEAERRQQGSNTSPSATSLQCRERLIGMPGPGGLSLRYQASGVTSRELAKWLAPYARRPVIDRTGLTGDFDVELTFRPEESPSTVAPDPAAPLSVAVQEQLGLKLESSRETIDILVIDSAQMPTPN